MMTEKEMKYALSAACQYMPVFDGSLGHTSVQVDAGIALVVAVGKAL
jgi:hypothetical protein